MEGYRKLGLREMDKIPEIRIRVRSSFPSPTQTAFKSVALPETGEEEEDTMIAVGVSVVVAADEGITTTLPSVGAISLLKSISNTDFRTNRSPSR